MLAATKGVIAAGHDKTAEAGQYALAMGGNAFDAIVAAFFTACVAEPVLASLAGGGYLLARAAGQSAVVYDCFTQSPITQRPQSEIQFFPIMADFGTAQQEFHIGLGAVATPGVVKGIWQVHRELCRLPMSVLMEPAIECAKQGVRFNRMQSHIFEIIGSVYNQSEQARQIFASQRHPGQLLGVDEWLQQPQLADTLAALVSEGDDLLYHGELAHAIANVCEQQGGHLTLADLAQYHVIKREPLAVDYRGHQILTNPAPSAGGLLIAFALQLAKHIERGEMQFGSEQQLQALTHVLTLTQQARVEQQAQQQPGEPLDHELILDPAYLQQYRQQIVGRLNCFRGTTHISVIDEHSNMASMTVSNGEGCGYMLPDTGVMLNNMLGEQDLHPYGFHQWQCNQRLASMMSPSFIFAEDGRQVATGSGGSNRIRSSVLQVILNLLDSGMDVAQAVKSPRIHLEDDLLSIEGGFSEHQAKLLSQLAPRSEVWKTPHLFFGGAHTVCYQPQTGVFEGAGDARRDGVAL